MKFQTKTISYNYWKNDFLNKRFITLVQKTESASF